MSEDNNQNLKEKKVTLDLTEEELEEYKTYLKFKNKFEGQYKSQNTTEATYESVEEVKTEDKQDPNFTFTQESINNMGYKQFFGKCIDESIAEPPEKTSIFFNIQLVAWTCVFYYSSRNLHGVFWSMFKCASVIGILYYIWLCIDERSRTTKRSLLKPNIRKYNELVKGENWIKVSNNDKNFDRYNSIAQDVVKNRLCLEFNDIEFRRDKKYTEVYQISNSDMFVVFGIFDGIRAGRYRYVAYMIAIENGEYLLNVIGKQICDTK